MNDKTKNIINTILFTTIFVGLFLVNTILSDKDLSSSERRKLKQFPELTFDKILDTSFMDEFDKYVLDQFILRDAFRSIKTNMELTIFNKKDNNDLFVYNNYIFKNLYPLNEKEVEITAKKIKYIQDLYLKDMNVYYTIIPDKNYYLNDNLGYLKIDYQKLISIMNSNLTDMEYIDIFHSLNLSSYYRTDIHWRQDQLYNVLAKLAEQMGFYIDDNYIENIISNFKGSYHGQLALNIKEDTIKYLTNEVLDKIMVYNYETNEYNSIYDLKKKDNVDMYDIFLSGPSALLDINNPYATTDKELIVFRDSFGSSLIPLLVNDYKKITVIDIRYISSDYLSNFVDFNNQDVLFMYSTNIINSGSILK